MKRFLKSLLLALMAFCFSLPLASPSQAATLVLLPLYNNTQNEDAGPIFFTGVLQALKTKALEDFELRDNDAVNAAIAKHTSEEKFPDADAMAEIAKDAGVDVVLGFELTAMDDDQSEIGYEEDYIFLNIKGNVVAYNGLTGKAYKHKIYCDKKLEMVFTSRWNPLNEEWGRIVRVETERALTAKK